MAPQVCGLCTEARAVIVRPKNQDKLCKACFISTFEEEIHETIQAFALFERGERIAIGASGGKDSTVLASVLKTLNERHDYGLELLLLSVDEGIRGYRDDSLKTVKRNASQYDMPLEIVGYGELYGWTMDEVVAQVGKKGNCTYCGVFRRQALDRGAERLKISHVVTGHNADDIAETVMMNLLRGDLPRLARATSIVTESLASNIKRSKPLKYAYEKEIVLYAHHKKLDYFSTECIYSPDAFRGSARTLIKDLEKVQPSSILDIVRSGEDMAKMVPPEIQNPTRCQGMDRVAGKAEEKNDKGCTTANGRDHVVSQPKRPTSPETVELDADQQGAIVRRLGPVLSASGFGQSKNRQATTEASKPSIHDKKARGRQKVVAQQAGKCERCGYLTSQKICKACTLLEGLNKCRPRMTIEIGPEEEESNTTMARQVAALQMSG